MEETNVITREIIISLVIVLVAVMMYFVAKTIIGKIMEKSRKTTKKGRTYIKLFNNILKYALILIAGVAILQVYGINVTSIITGLGVVSAVAALALQDALKDIIMGVNIIVDNYFSVGDVIKVNGVDGKVTEIGLKCTKIKDLDEGKLITVENRNICEAQIVPDYFFITIPIAYTEKIERVEEVFDGIIEKIKQIDEVNDAIYRGLNKFDESSINYTIKIFAKADQKIEAKYKANRIIKQELDRNEMKIPFNQIDVHYQETK